MRNTSRNLEKQPLRVVLQDYPCDLRRESYHPNWILTCLEAATTGYGRKIKQEIQGATPINRPAHLGSMTSRMKALTSKSIWFQCRSKAED